MLDAKFIRENPEKVRETIRIKGMEAQIDFDKLLQTDKRYLEVLQKVELHRALRNQLTQGIVRATDDKKSDLVTQATVIKEELEEMEKELTSLLTVLKLSWEKIPNIISPDTPVGKDDTENKVIRKHLNPANMDFKPKDHMELGEKLDLIDIETASKVSGSRFCYLKNQAVLMQFALIQYVIGTLTNKKIIEEIAKAVGNLNFTTFIPIIPPVIMRPDVMQKMARLNPIEERYYYPEDPSVLVGSAEHTLGPIYMDSTLSADKLPVRYLGYSTAFRREAGSYGKDVKGIIRVHQFDKLEMECFTTSELGLVEQDFLVAIQERILQDLELPYQVVQVCTGDMGKPDYRQIDMEVWFPSQNKYRETHSADYTTDYQSRRLNSFYRIKGGGKELMHMNDATALAIGRTIVAILENYQQQDGSVVVPKVLRPYMGGLEVIK